MHVMREAYTVRHGAERALKPGHREQMCFDVAETKAGGPKLPGAQNAFEDN